MAQGHFFIEPLPAADDGSVGACLSIISPYSLNPILTKCPSCIAARVATTDTMAPLYFRSMTVNVSGSTNNIMPVTLFITVCAATNSFRITYPEMMLIPLISAMTAIQIKSHTGISSTGIIFIRHTVTRIISATVSSCDPNSLTVPVFLATVPSIHVANSCSNIQGIELW